MLTSSGWAIVFPIPIGLLLQVRQYGFLMAPVPKHKWFSGLAAWLVISFIAAGVGTKSSREKRQPRSLSVRGRAVQLQVSDKFSRGYLKIDGSFIRDIIHNPVSRAIVKSMTEVEHIMGKKIFAEFVENKTTVEILRETGVDHYQGFLLSTPAGSVKMCHTRKSFDSSMCYS